MKMFNAQGYCLTTRVGVDCTRGQDIEGDVTGREAILKAVSGVLDAEKVADNLAAMGYVCVPRIPSEEMIKAAWAYELAEDAAGVWRTMIEAFECQLAGRVEKRER